MTTLSDSASASRLAVSADTLTCVDLVPSTSAGRASLVDKHTLMTHDKAAAAAALHELDVLLTLQPHAAVGHVVALHSFRLDQTTQRLHVLMEHCARGDLFSVAQHESRLLRAQLLSPHHGLTTCERALRRVAFQTLRGLRTLHTHGIAHMDLSLENVFVTATGDVRIGDFALALRFQRDATGRVLPLPHAAHVAKPTYAAPELFTSGRAIQDVTKADAWSLGVMLWQLVTRSPLFPTGAPTLQDPVFRTILQSTAWADRLLPTASSGLCDLLSGLLDPNASTRLSVDAALQHAWFTGKSVRAVRTPEPQVIHTLSAPVVSSKRIQQRPSVQIKEDDAGKKGTPHGRGRRDRTASAEISLDATRVAIRPSLLRRP